jgi:kumamolisin
MDAISISWGGPEDAWDAATMKAYDVELAACAAAGITVTVAAGDNGSSDGERGNHVDFPASSPHVLACGGTSIPSTSPLTETVWNDGSAGGATGGGVSAVFGMPTYQAKAGVPGGGRMRGVPDVAGNADPETGWIIVIDGQQTVIGGTSAVAPMWAALAVCLSEALGKNVGALHSALYGIAGWNRDITSGNNGTFVAKSGYDCCTGNGVPVGTKLLAILKPAPVPAPVPTPTPAPVPPPAPKPVSKTETITITGTDFTVKTA